MAESWPPPPPEHRAPRRDRDSRPDSAVDFLSDSQVARREMRSETTGPYPAVVVNQAHDRSTPTNGARAVFDLERKFMYGAAALLTTILMSAAAAWGASMGSRLNNLEELERRRGEVVTRLQGDIDHLRSQLDTQRNQLDRIEQKLDRARGAVP